MQRDTMFRIASMTKPVTVAAAMTLVDEGKLALTDPVTKWLPELSEHAGADRPARPAGRHRPARATDHLRRPDDPPQRAGLLVLGDRARWRGRTRGCRTGRTRTAGWPNWPRFRWRINPATG